jgi:protease-4
LLAGVKNPLEVAMKIAPTILSLMLIAMFFFGCASPRITLFSDATDPLREVTLAGTADDKVLVISIAGVITDVPKRRFARTMPSVVQEVVSQLRLAEKDDRIKAVLFKIDSPGGTATASDILYHEIVAFKQRSGAKVVVSMMNLATSGGYYVSLSADVIMAHPTTVTGSIGVILMRPEVSGFMEKIGVDVQVNKSGENKDMGSPFRPTTPAEEAMLQELADSLGRRFVDLVKQHRELDSQEMTSVAGARVFLADAAVAAGLVDKTGYLQDAIDEAKAIAGIDADARVVTYRRSDFANDNIYNTLTSGSPVNPTPLLEMGHIADLLSLDAGFYYIWPQALGSP